MVKPLYPLSDISPERRKRMRDAEKAKKEAKKAYIIALCKNPYLISTVLLVGLLLSVTIIHFSRSNKTLNASASVSDPKSDALSFFRPSKYFTKAKNKDAGVTQKEELVKMGIDDNVESMGMKVTAKDLREERKILAMRKYEASRQTAERRTAEKKEQRDRLMSGSARQLKEAVMAVEDSSNLGIMKLERLLDEKYLSKGGDRNDLDVLVFAYDRLAKAYEKKNMEGKAKEAYINAFKLMKEQAPDSQGPDWDIAISSVEQLRAKPSR